MATQISREIRDIMWKRSIQRFECYSWVARDVRHHFLKSKIKEPPKLLSSSGMKGE